MKTKTIEGIEYNLVPTEENADSCGGCDLHRTETCWSNTIGCCETKIGKPDKERYYILKRVKDT